SGYVLNGVKTVIQDGAVADRVIVSAQDDTSPGLSLFVLDCSAPGLHWSRYRTQDGRNAADLRFENLTVGAEGLLGAPGTGLASIELA
ncbi:acyl-CoA dehydrogenase family protein, partial [Vibrio parahaemolyticus]